MRGVLGRGVVKLVLASFIAGLTGVLAQVGFNLGPVPYTMQNVGVVLAGLLLPLSYAFISMLLYLTLVFLGFPMGAGFQGGPAVILGYEGGYFLGFLLAAPILSLMSRAYFRLVGRDLTTMKGRDFAVLVVVCAVSTLPIYLLGFIVFSFYAYPGSSLYAWSLNVDNSLNLKSGNPYLTLFVASALIFMPQDFLMDHVIGIVIASALSRLMHFRGV
ncbi:MAG: biotin transporter BioY [Desulfurococcales archaeon]|nr:biotin transporter BioY [Desulfurococcales archaeon]